MFFYYIQYKIIQWISQEKECEKVKKKRKQNQSRAKQGKN